MRVFKITYLTNSDDNKHHQLLKAIAGVHSLGDAEETFYDQYFKEHEDFTDLHSVVSVELVASESKLRIAS